jgi:hypothetical protein
MAPSDTPTETEKVFAYLLSLFVPTIGFVLGVFWLTYPMRGFKIAGRNCLLISVVPIIVVAIVVYGTDLT